MSSEFGAVNKALTAYVDAVADRTKNPRKAKADKDSVNNTISELADGVVSHAYIGNRDMVRSFVDSIGEAAERHYNGDDTALQDILRIRQAILSYTED